MAASAAIFRCGKRSVLPLLILAACSPAPRYFQSGAAPDAPTVILEAHNSERRTVGARSLSWDPALSAAAASHARQLASSGQLRHSSRAARTGHGENLWIGTRGAFSARQMVASWASEKANFRPGVFPAVSRRGPWSTVGHYTQMIWPTTTHLGCAIANGARFDVLVCRYAPAGNTDGRRVP